MTQAGSTGPQLIDKMEGSFETLENLDVRVPFALNNDRLPFRSTWIFFFPITKNV